MSDVASLLGSNLDPDAVTQVPTQVVVGALDDHPVDLAGVAVSEGGSSRLERATALSEALAALGGDVRLDVVPRVGHDVLGVVDAASAFLAAASAEDR